ncbi:hypothetical protein J6590_004337 [Homalodisca vitripennis]|nr:hypothetical protein J6590_004337 [Homalodisca vitripennis]
MAGREGEADQGRDVSYCKHDHRQCACRIAAPGRCVLSPVSAVLHKTDKRSNKQTPVEKK